MLSFLPSYEISVYIRSQRPLDEPRIVTTIQSLKVIDGNPPLCKFK